jgi:hypothetical protein
VVLLAVAAVILIGVIAVAVGRGGELDPAEADYRPVDLDEVTSTDVALMRPPTALFGYHREATDAAFGQIARSISECEVEIATLRRQLAEQLPVRTSPVLRADPGPRADPAQRADTMGPEPPGPGFGAGPRPVVTGPGTGPMTKAGLPARPPTRPPARLPEEPPAPPSAGSLWQAPQHAQGQAPAPPLPSRPVSSWPPQAATKLPEPMPNSSMPHIPLAGQDQAQTHAQPPGPAGPAAAPGASLPSRAAAQPPGRLPSRPAEPGTALPSGPARPAGPAPSRPVTPAPAGPPPPGPPAGTHGPEMPSRPSVLHRELADRAGAPEPGAEADPWLVWQRRTEQPATQDSPPPAVGPHHANDGPHPASDGAQDAASDPGEQR